MPPRVALIGSPVLDTLRLADGTEFQSFGGILYSLAAMARHAGDRLALYPVFYIGEAERPALEALLREWPGVHPDHIKTAEATHRNLLVYHPDGSRTEYFQARGRGLSLQDLLPVLEFEGFFVNYIHPSDLPREVFRSLSRGTTGWLYLDVHSLIRTPDDAGVYRARQLPGWQEVLSWVDLVQMNEEEARVLTGLELPPGPEGLAVLLQMILTLGPSVATVTLGSQGALMAERLRRKNRAPVLRRPPQVVQARHTTGCGDVFGAVFFAEFLLTEDPYRALEAALRRAAEHAAGTFLPFPLGL